MNSPDFGRFCLYVTGELWGNGNFTSNPCSANSMWLGERNSEIRHDISQGRPGHVYQPVLKSSMMINDTVLPSSDTQIFGAALSLVTYSAPNCAGSAYLYVLAHRHGPLLAE